MLMNKRLTPEEAKQLGLPEKDKTKHGNPKYSLTDKEWELVQEMRERTVSYKTAMMPKILVFDIETAPLKSYTWGIWNQNIGLNQLIDDWFMLTWAAKWLFSDTVMSDKLTSKEAIEEDDKRITKNLWKLIDEADIVIAHNGDKFDIKKINTRFLKHRLGLPSSYQSIDTLKIARKTFSFTSNKLDALATFLGFEGKMSTGGFDLWKRCMEGDKEAFLIMEEYNKQDVVVLENVYLELRPYAKSHPNIGLYVGDGIERCPCCGSDQVTPNSEYYSNTSVYVEYLCNSCGSRSRTKKSTGSGNPLTGLSR